MLAAAVASADSGAFRFSRSNRSLALTSVSCRNNRRHVDSSKEVRLVHNTVHLIDFTGCLAQAGHPGYRGHCKGTL